MSISVYTPTINNIVHRTKVDFGTRSIIPEIINLVQYDVMIPVIEIDLYLDGNAYTLPTSIEIVKLRMSKTGRDHIYKNTLGTNISRTSVYFPVDSEMTANYGTYNPILELISDGQLVAGSSKMIFNIDKNPIKEMEEA